MSRLLAKYVTVEFTFIQVQPMLYIVLISIAVLVALFLIIVAMRPAQFRVTRSTTIAAPPSAIFPHVNDLHNWKAWSPWAKLDLNMKETHEGAPAGVGASYHWVGNSKVGEGRMTIIESNPSDLIRIKLEFMKPFKATNTAQFTFKPEGNQTLVVWDMIGNNNFMCKAFSLFMNMDKMVGSDFEKGLAGMKSLVEAS
jgi:hypothetical protein